MEHLEKGHKVVFKIKELIELSEVHPEELEPAADEESQGEGEQLLTAAPETSETHVDTTAGKTIGQYYFWTIPISLKTKSFDKQIDSPEFKWTP